MTSDDLPRATSAGELDPETAPAELPPTRRSRRALREAREREAREREARARRETLAARRDHAAAIASVAGATASKADGAAAVAAPADSSSQAATDAGELPAPAPRRSLPAADRPPRQEATRPSVKPKRRKGVAADAAAGDAAPASAASAAAAATGPAGRSTADVTSADAPKPDAPKPEPDAPAPNAVKAPNDAEAATPTPAARPATKPPAPADSLAPQPARGRPVGGSTLPAYPRATSPRPAKEAAASVPPVTAPRDDSGDADTAGADATKPLGALFARAAASPGDAARHDGSGDTTTRVATDTTPADAPAADDGEAGTEPAPRETPAALEWVDPLTVAERSTTAAFSTAPHRPVTGPDLLPERKRRLAGVLAPVATAGGLVLAYTATCLMWPLDNVAPTVSEQQIDVAAGPAMAAPWPSEGTAAVAPVGLVDRAAVESNERLSMASITKLATVLMILEKQPLATGEQGPEYHFTWADHEEYLYDYLWSGQSSLDVPVDGTLTQYQMLEGILLGSANNYANRLVDELWGSREAFAADAAAWLERNGFRDMTVVEPSGLDRENAATAAEILRLGELALQHPVVAEIVAKKETWIPGTDEPVENSNPLINDEGIVGLKTGTFDDSLNLVSAKRIDVDGETVTVLASVLGQPDRETRDRVSRELLAAAEASLQPTTAVAAGTPIAEVTTDWGARAEIVTSADATLVFWNGAVPAVEQDIDELIGHLEGDRVGELTATGSFSTETVELELTDDIGAPSLWWRLTHPLDLLGLH